MNAIKGLPALLAASSLSAWELRMVLKEAEQPPPMLTPEGYLEWFDEPKKLPEAAEIQWELGTSLRNDQDPGRSQVSSSEGHLAGKMEVMGLATP